MATPARRLVGLPAVIRQDARLLVLGSFPGTASLQAQQYYGHPRNQFWPILSALWQLELTAMPYAQRLQVAQEHQLGIWDVYASCLRQGSLDQAIKDAQYNDFAQLRQQAPQLQHVAHNGAESARAQRHLQALGFEVHVLPSTSPAHASWSFERKLAAWRALLHRCAIVAR